jgi:hypothetical protein
VETRSTYPGPRRAYAVAVIDTTRPSLTIVKSMTYRGAPEEWSNTYFMDGTLPASPSSWKVLADAVIAEEKGLYDSGQAVVRAIGHQAGQSVAVWAYDYLAHSESVAGTFDTSGTFPQSGDTAAWIRWSTDALTSKGKPIYLRSYFHPAYAFGDLESNRDEVAASWITAAEEYGADWIAGFNDGDAVTHHRAGPHGVTGLVALASAWCTTRTLERRGKRP